eukprot:CAMPEP_0183388072 /NCGR_PEP_ID=MMETSP0370-20130417/3789_1 /TAXON_ID=268820 /ORGANISM="Peridinium aciculiferum, Strain PAER-2" /LENGTH=139 /DNA_ID=CAMNT_0025566893 /DNA_START=151 /DNA_END=571 /DNA_ORIENTATION=+
MTRTSSRPAVPPRRAPHCNRQRNVWPPPLGRGGAPPAAAGGGDGRAGDVAAVHPDRLGLPLRSLHLQGPRALPAALQPDLIAMGFGFFYLWAHTPYKCDHYEGFYESPLYNFVKADLEKTGQLEENVRIKVKHFYPHTE